MNQPRVLLADDHAVVAEALVGYLRQECDVVDVVRDGWELIVAVRKWRPDIVVADIGMPGMNGLEALRQLKSEHLETKVIFLTMHAEIELAVEAMRAGAAGYALKNAAGEELFSAIRQVMSGKVYLSPEIASNVISALSAPVGSGAPQLTVRQREVLQLIVEGRTMKEIGAILELSPRTIETHKYDMMQRLKVETTVELVQYAAHHGIGEN